MKGGIYTREHCPVCNRNFQRINGDLICPDHFTRPKKVFIQLYSKQLHQRVHIFVNQKGQSLSYDEADRILTVIRAEIDRVGDFDPTRYVTEKLKPLRFVNWSREWLKKKEIEVEKGRKAPSYVKALRVYLRKYQAYFKETDIREIGTKAVNDFYLSSEGSPKYIKNLMDGLRKMLHDAYKWGDIKIMPEFEKIDVPEPAIKTIDMDEQDKIIAAIPDQMDRTFILLTARLMLRPCEPRALYWEDIDFKHHRVTICRHFSLNEIRPATKSKNVKTLPLDVELEQALLALPRHLTSPFVFWKRNGQSFSESWARKLWARACNEQGVKISLYQGTKHSSATEAVNRVGVDATQEFLGHTNRAMTKRYAKVSAEGLKRVLREK